MDGNVDDIREGGEEAKHIKKPHERYRRDQELSFARVILSADRGWRLRAPDSSARKARCLYTHIAPRGYERPWDGKERMGLEAGSKFGGGNGEGNGVGGRNGDMNGHTDGKE